jgi:ArsR family transcriptional regulator
MGYTIRYSFETMQQTMSRKSLLHFPQPVYEKNATLYRIMANPKRLHMLNLLAQKEMSVDELAREVGMRMANASQHLAVLRSNRFVATRRAGTRVLYRITDPRIVEPCAIFKKIYHL